MNFNPLIPHVANEAQCLWKKDCEGVLRVACDVPICAMRFALCAMSLTLRLIAGLGEVPD